MVLGDPILKQFRVIQLGSAACTLPSGWLVLLALEHGPWVLVPPGGKILSKLKHYFIVQNPLCHRLLKNVHAKARDRTGDPLIER